MQIVIDIHEKDYLSIKNGHIPFSILDSIMNSTPLPKGHGDLKDMSNLQYVFDLTIENPIYSGKDIERAINLMKTIIEADKEYEVKIVTRGKCMMCGKELDEGLFFCKECKALEQESCEDEYIKVPKKALKYRTAGMVAYNAEWLKDHFDIERAVICGAQEPCEDAISRQAVLDVIEPQESEERK